MCARTTRQTPVHPDPHLCLPASAFLQLSSSLSELEAAAKSQLILHPQAAASVVDDASKAAAADERDRRRGGPRTGGFPAAQDEDTVVWVLPEWGFFKRALLDSP